MPRRNVLLIRRKRLLFGIVLVSFYSGSMDDVLQVANCLLDIGDRQGVPITHLSLQKIVYFSHGLAYASLRQPLILNRIEAWKRGPVVRELYFSFNSYGERPIDGRATMLDFETKQKERVAYDFPEPVLKHLEEVFRIYGPISASRLVAMTHEKGTPWDQTIRRAVSHANVGMHIDETLIKTFFAPESSDRIQSEH